MNAKTAERASSARPTERTPQRMANCAVVVRIVAAGILLLACATENLYAQAARNRESEEEIYQGTFALLFRSIALSPERQLRAMEIIQDERQKQRALRMRMPELWEKRIALNASRDSALRRLLISAKESTTFELASREMRPKPLKH